MSNEGNEKDIRYDAQGLSFPWTTADYNTASLGLLILPNTDSEKTL